VVLLHRDDFTTICFAGMHLVTTVFAFLGLIFYIVGFPALAFVLLCRHLSPIVSGLQLAALAAGEKQVGGESDAKPIDRTPGIGGITSFLIARVPWLRPHAQPSASKYKPDVKAASDAELSRSSVRRQNYMEDGKPALKEAGPSTAALTLQSAWSLYDASVRTFGVLFVGVKLEQFTYRVSSYLFLLVQAAFVSLIYDVPTQLFALAVCYVLQGLAISWLQPMHTRRTNKWLALLYIFAAAHCGLMIAVQDEISILIYPLAGLWLFTFLVNWKRSRLQRWLSKRFPRLVPVRLQQTASTSAAVLADGGVGDMLVQKAAASPKPEYEIAEPRLRRPQRAATIASTAGNMSTTTTVAATANNKGVRLVIIGKKDDKHSQSSEHGTGDSSSPPHSQRTSSSGGNKGSDGEKDLKRGSVSVTPPTGAAAGTVTESRKRMPSVVRRGTIDAAAISPSSKGSHHASSGSENSPQVGGRSLMPGGVEPVPSELPPARTTVVASEPRGSVSSHNNSARGHRSSRLLEHAPVVAVTAAASSSSSSDPSSPPLPLSPAPVTLAAMSLPYLPPAPVSANSSPQASPRQPGRLGALPALPPIAMGRALPPVVRPSPPPRQDEFPEESKEQPPPVAATVAAAAVSGGERPDGVARAESAYVYQPQLIEYDDEE
jgi:hypothetical protein